MMTKAYDFKALVDEVKKELPEIGEESVKIVVKAIFPWLSESAKLSETKIDDVLSMGYPMLEAKLSEVAEDINKADNV
jgi:hypothetical protein